MLRHVLIPVFRHMLRHLIARYAKSATELASVRAENQRLLDNATAADANGMELRLSLDNARAELAAAVLQIDEERNTAMARMLEQQQEFDGLNESLRTLIHQSELECERLRQEADQAKHDAQAAAGSAEMLIQAERERCETARQAVELRHDKTRDELRLAQEQCVAAQAGADRAKMLEVQLSQLSSYKAKAASVNKMVAELEDLQAKVRELQCLLDESRKREAALLAVNDRVRADVKRLEGKLEEAVERVEELEEALHTETAWAEDLQSQLEIARREAKRASLNLQSSAVGRRSESGGVTLED